jgi:hypothetical protein
MPETTWKPYGDTELPGRLFTAETNSLPDTSFAFPRARKEPMTARQAQRLASVAAPLWLQRTGR